MLILAVTVYQTLFGFDDLNSFEEFWSCFVECCSSGFIEIEIFTYHEIHTFKGYDKLNLKVLLVAWFC